MTALCRSMIHPHAGECPLPQPLTIFGFALQAPVPTAEQMVPAGMVSQMERYKPETGILTCCNTTWKRWHDSVEETLCWVCDQPGRDLAHLDSDERAAVPSPSPSSAQMNLSESTEQSP